MKDFENVIVTVLEQKPLSPEQSSFAKRLLKSSGAFERLVAKLAMQMTKDLRNECAHNPMREYAPEVLFRLFYLSPTTIVRSTKVKNFVFEAAVSKRVPDRINATQVLARIADREKTAYTLLRKLREDEDETVRHNARIFLSKLSAKRSASVAS